MAQEPQSDQLHVLQQMLEQSVQRTTMSAERSRMSAERSEMSSERTYLNAERTLSVWVRTALSLMIFGIAIARFELLLMEAPSKGVHVGAYADAISTWTGFALIAFGTVMSLATGLRFLAYAVRYRRNHALPSRHAPYLATSFALLVVLFGVALLAMLAGFAR
ncbi:MAG TPA: DUF202 domain-containing protein [Rhodanobacteraceae bacterium]|nr:DUF202 domain-containing protein [Rhodanobacteraceae bacterium]